MSDGSERAAWRDAWRWFDTGAVAEACEAARESGDFDIAREREALLPLPEVSNQPPKPHSKRRRGNSIFGLACSVFADTLTPDSEPLPRNTTVMTAPEPLSATYMSRADIAREFGVTRETVADWAQAGSLGPEDRIGNAFVYLRAEVERFKAEREQKNGGQS